MCVKTIIFCYDGDDPGKEAVIGNGTKPGLASQFSKAGFEVRAIVPPDGYDPDDMPFSYIKVLRQMVVNNGGELIPKNYGRLKTL